MTFIHISTVIYILIEKNCIHLLSAFSRLTTHMVFLEKHGVDVGRCQCCKERNPSFDNQRKVQLQAVHT